MSGVGTTSGSENSSANRFEVVPLVIATAAPLAKMVALTGAEVMTGLLLTPTIATVTGSGTLPSAEIKFRVSESLYPSAKATTLGAPLLTVWRQAPLAEVNVNVPYVEVAPT